MVTISPYSNTTVHPSWLTVLTDPVRINVLHALCILGGGTASALASRVNTSNRTARRHLEAMVTLGIVHEHAGASDGLTPGRPASRFALDAGARRKAVALFELLREPLGPSP